MKEGPELFDSVMQRLPPGATLAVETPRTTPDKINGTIELYELEVLEEGVLVGDDPDAPSQPHLYRVVRPSQKMRKAWKDFMASTVQEGEGTN